MESDSTTDVISGRSPLLPCSAASCRDSVVSEPGGASSSDGIVAPLYPIVHAVGSHCSVRVFSRTNVALTFRASARSCRFHVGAYPSSNGSSSQVRFVWWFYRHRFRSLSRAFSNRATLIKKWCGLYRRKLVIESLFYIIYCFACTTDVNTTSSKAATYRRNMRR